MLTREELSKYGFETLTLSSGLNVNYRDEGPRDAPTVLLVHGGGDSLNTWDGWVPKLTRQFRVVRFDLPGHGLSDPYPDGEHNSRKFAATLKLFVDEYRLRDFCLVGHSFGGESALHYMTEQRGRADALVLVGPGAYAPDAEDFGHAATGGADVPPPNSLDDILKVLYFDRTKVPQSFVTTISELSMYDKNQGAFESLEKGSAELYQEVVGAETITIPTLILAGNEDLIVNVDSICRRLAREIPHAELIVYPEVGHMIQHETEQSLADATAFIRRTLEGAVRE